MRLQLFVAVALLATFAAAASIDATDADFDTIVAQHPFAIVEFYAPWCGHCKRLAPEWEAASEQLEGKAALIKVDCTVEKEVASRFGISGFPTLKVFRDGQVANDYDGGRTADAIVKYALSNLGPAVTVVASEAELETLKGENDIVVVAFAAEGSAVAQAHESVAKQLRSRFRFARADGALGAEAADSVVLYKTFDSPRVVLEGEVNAATVQKFVQDESVRLFDEIGPENYRSYLDRGLPMVWLFAAPDAEAEKSAAAAAAEGFKGTASFVWCDSVKYGQMAERLGIPKGQFPSLAVDQQGKHFVFGESIATEAIAAFVGKVLAGDVKPTIRSEPEPAQAVVDGLTTAVGTTFDELVRNNANDVFVEFYAPWCGHCKKLDPEIKKLAKGLAATAGLSIVQFDASSNDHDQALFPVKGFPTLYFYPKSKEAPQVFEGTRTAAGILEYLKGVSTASFDAVAADSFSDEL